MENKLTIKGFKCFLEKEVPIRGLTVLAGSNSVGKSTVIQSILLLRSAYEKARSGIGQVLLNGDYLLGLGNTSNIVNSKLNTDIIEFSLEINGALVFTRLKVDSRRPQVFLDTVYPEMKNLSINAGNPIEKKHFQYLHAERLGPRPFYGVSGQGRHIGWQGEFTISLLSSPEADTPDYFVPVEKMFPGSSKPNLNSQAEYWMQSIIPGITIDAKQIQETNQSHVLLGGNSPYNVGFGISYVLPIIVAGLIAQKGEMLIVENPEAHLHPSGQSKIGQFLATVAASGVEVLVETHSEHVINGIRVANLNGILDASDILVNFFKKESNGEVTINAINVNISGDLISYPPGFFDQEQQDFATIVKLKRAKLETR